MRGGTQREREREREKLQGIHRRGNLFKCFEAHTWVDMSIGRPLIYSTLRGAAMTSADGTPRKRTGPQNWPKGSMGALRHKVEDPGLLIHSHRFGFQAFWHRANSQ
jgi:hypothetical protein